MCGCACACVCVRVCASETNLAPGYPSEYLLDITLPRASRTDLEVKFSDAIRLSWSRWRTFSCSMMSKSSGSASSRQVLSCSAEARASPLMQAVAPGRKAAATATRRSKARLVIMFCSFCRARWLALDKESEQILHRFAIHFGFEIKTVLPKRLLHCGPSNCLRIIDHDVTILPVWLCIALACGDVATFAHFSLTRNVR